MDAKLKHLELIQGVIDRMAQNSFLFKGWAITIAAGVSAFAASSTTRGIVGIALGSTAIFWGLDAYYLRLERCFIDLYGHVARTEASKVDLQMSIDKSDPVRRWLQAVIRPHNFAFYGTLLAGELVTLILIGGKC